MRTVQSTPFPPTCSDPPPPRHLTYSQWVGICRRCGMNNGLSRSCARLRGTATMPLPVHIGRREATHCTRTARPAQRNARQCPFGRAGCCTSKCSVPAGAMGSKPSALMCCAAALCQCTPHSLGLRLAVVLCCAVLCSVLRCGCYRGR